MDSVHLVQSFYEACQNDPALKGGILFLDQEKAFDRVDHGFLIRILQTFGFGPSFIKWIHLSYKDAKAQIKINGHLTNPIPVRCGVRQGDPLSFLLFTMVIETLSLALKKCEGLSGFDLPGLRDRIKISLYADDTSIFFSNPSELPLIYSCLEKYSIASDAKLNLSKCQAAVINQPLPPPNLQISMQWLLPLHSVEYLGIHVGTKPEIEETWNSTFEKISKTLAVWKRRNLSLTRRILIAKTLGISKVSYLSFALAPSKKQTQELDSIIWHFIRKGKKDRVARSITTQSCNDGGLNGFSVPSYLASLRLKMLQRAILMPDLPWSRYLHHRLRTCSGSWNLDLPSLLTSLIPSHQLQLPIYWKLTLKDWQLLAPHPPIPIMTPEMMLSQPLFLNPEITIDGKVLSQTFWRSIQQKDLTSINHLWNGQHWRSVQELRAVLNIRIKTNTLLLLRSAIPLDWRDHIMEYPPTPTPNFLPQIVPETLQTDTGGPAKMVVRLSCKDIRNRITSLINTTPPCIEYWENRWATSISWPHVWKNISMIPDNKMKDTVWLMIHRKLALSDLLLRWFPDSTFPCPHCPGIDGSIPHTFISCPLAKHLWDTSISKWNSSNLPPLTISEPLIITGLHPTLSLKNPLSKTWRALHSATIYSLWLARCRALHGESFNNISTSNLHSFITNRLTLSLNIPKLF